MKKNCPDKKRYFKLRYKMILFYILICLIPIVLLGSYLNVAVSRNSTEQSIRIYRQSTQQLWQNIVSELQSYYSIGYDIAYDANVIEYLDDYEANDLEQYNFYVGKIEVLLNKARYKSDNVSARIYTPNTHLKMASLFIRDRALFEEKLRIMQNSGSFILWNGLTNKNEKDYLSLLLLITNYNISKEPVGVLEIQIDRSDLQAFIPSNRQNKNVIFVLNENDVPIISNVPMDEHLDRLIKVGDREMVQYGGEKYLLTRESVNNTKIKLHGWSICNLIPLDDVYKNRRDIQNASLAVIMICILILVPLLILFSRHITGRVEFLIQRIKDVKSGKYQVSVVVKGNDEIAQMSCHFDSMLREIDHLMHQVYEAQLKEQILENAQKEAQLLALQQQINPHYLFNTMETIRMNLLLKGDSETSEIVRIFADSFREMIDSTCSTISLHEEITFIHKYFLIQKYRYEDKIDLVMDISDDLPNYHIPKFLLQPLIENAVYHGLELKDGKGTIHLAIRSEEKLRIVVSDDGIGMTEKEICNLRKSILSDSKDRQNYALRNIFKRLKLLYGEASEFEIDSIPDEGTVVRLSIPLDQLKEEATECIKYC